MEINVPNIVETMSQRIHNIMTAIGGPIKY